MNNNPESDFVICGIDPGTVTLGCAFMSVNIKSLEITGIKPHTMNAKHFQGNSLSESYTSVNTTERHVNIMLHEDNLVSNFNYYTPSVIAYESPFIHFRRPQAYGALVEVVEAIRRAARRYDHDVSLRGYSPAIVKKGVRAASGGNKKEVKDAIQEIPELIKHLKLERMSEHSIDATAVAYSYLTEYREFLKCRNRTI